VNIEEDKQSPRARQRSNEGRRRIRELTTQFGTATAKDKVGIDYEGSDVESDAGLYGEISAAIMVEDWVGPIRATIEVWHMVDGTPKLRQPPIARPHYYVQISFANSYRLFCPSHQFHKT
jgi:hypothetical protein